MLKNILKLWMLGMVSATSLTGAALNIGEVSARGASIECSQERISNLQSESDEGTTRLERARAARDRR